TAELSAPAVNQVHRQSRSSQVSWARWAGTLWQQRATTPVAVLGMCRIHVKKIAHYRSLGQLDAKSGRSLIVESHSAHSSNLVKPTVARGATVAWWSPPFAGQI